MSISIPDVSTRKLKGSIASFRSIEKEADVGLSKTIKDRSEMLIFLFLADTLQRRSLMSVRHNEMFFALISISRERSVMSRSRNEISMLEPNAPRRAKDLSKFSSRKKTGASWSSRPAILPRNSIDLLSESRSAICPFRFIASEKGVPFKLSMMSVLFSGAKVPLSVKSRDESFP